MKLFRYSNTPNDTYNPIESHTDDLCEVVVFLHEFDVSKETKCGSWIEFRGVRKFVNHTCIKQFAYKTKEEAKQSFIARKHRQISILTSQLKEAKESLVVIEQPTTMFIRGNMDFVFV